MEITNYFNNKDHKANAISLVDSFCVVEKQGIKELVDDNIKDFYETGDVCNSNLEYREETVNYEDGDCVTYSNIDTLFTGHLVQKLTEAAIKLIDSTKSKERLTLCALDLWYSKEVDDICFEISASSENGNGSKHIKSVISIDDFITDLK